MMSMHFVLELRLPNEPRKARALERDIVVVVEVVDADDRVAASEQICGDVTSR